MRVNIPHMDPVGIDSTSWRFDLYNLRAGISLVETTFTDLLSTTKNTWVAWENMGNQTKWAPTSYKWSYNYYK